VTDKITFALLIYRSSPGDPAASEAARALEGHRVLQAAARKDLHAVAQLAGTAGAKTVRVRQGAHEVTDGPYIETKEWLVGLYLLDCASLEQALDRARTICPVDDHVIEVRPVSWRWQR